MLSGRDGHLLTRNRGPSLRIVLHDLANPIWGGKRRQMVCVRPRNDRQHIVLGDIVTTGARFLQLILAQEIPTNHPWTQCVFRASRHCYLSGQTARAPSTERNLWVQGKRPSRMVASSRDACAKGKVKWWSGGQPASPGFPNVSSVFTFPINRKRLEYLPVGIVRTLRIHQLCIPAISYWERASCPLGSAAAITT